MIKLKHSVGKWLQHRQNTNPYIKSNEFEKARDYIRANYGKLHLVSTIERTFRLLKASPALEVANAKIPGERQNRWLIKKVDLSKLP